MVNLLYDFAISKRHPIFVQITADRTFKNALEKIQYCDSQDIMFFQSTTQHMSSIYPKWCPPAYVVYTLFHIPCFSLCFENDQHDWLILYIFRIRSLIRLKKTWWAKTSKWLSQVCLKWSYISFLYKHCSKIGPSFVIMNNLYKRSPAPTPIQGSL